MRDQQSFNPDDYPSIGPAYDLVLPTYDWALRRLDSIERRIDNLVRHVITITLAIPAGTAAIAGLTDKPINLVFNESTWIAIACFLVTLLWGLFVRQAGYVQVIDLEAICNKYMECAEDELKKNMISWAAEHAVANERLSRTKSHGADVMVALFVVEVGALLTWSYGVLG